MTDYFKDKEILITGGVGSLGTALVSEFLNNHKPKGIRIFSRDELKQWKMKQTLDQNAPVSFLVGDVRDLQRLKLATKGVDIVIHAAALKQVPSCEENPLEAIQTNVIGSQNVVYSALENNVNKVMGISTDKSVKPINLYGATKMCAEKLFIQSNTYSGGRTPYFSCCRYGNVVGSRGSIIPLFKGQIKKGKDLTVTHSGMTRFWITLKNAVQLILKGIIYMEGGEIFIPHMKSCKIEDIALMFAGKTEPPSNIVYTGIRPGEKLHEVMMSKEESTCSNYTPSFYVIRDKQTGVEPFIYSSDKYLVEDSNEIEKLLQL